MAAGFSLREADIEEFRRRLNEQADLKPEDFVRKIWIDVPMPLEYISEGLIEELKQDFYIAFFETTTEGVYNGELISLTENKGTAIRRTAELLHENADNTIAFGDSMNDYQMIRDAACGVAMGNADEKLKAIADRVCETVWEDGVICELKRMNII